MQALKQEQEASCDMIRDMELVRDILLTIEQDPMCNGQHLSTLDIPDRPYEEVFYHVGLMVKSGLVEGNLNINSVMPMVSGLTWNGHELLDNIRDDGIWAKTKERAKALPSVALTILVQIATSEVKKRLGLP